MVLSKRHLAGPKIKRLVRLTGEAKYELDKENIGMYHLVNETEK